MTIHGWAALVTCVLAFVVPGSTGAALACPTDPGPTPLNTCSASGDAWTHRLPGAGGRTIQPVTELGGTVPPPVDLAVAVPPGR